MPIKQPVPNRVFATIALNCFSSVTRATNGIAEVSAELVGRTEIGPFDSSDALRGMLAAGRDELFFIGKVIRSVGRYRTAAE